MAYEFTKLSDVEIAESPSSAANILIEDGGIIQKVPASSVGGNSNNSDSNGNSSSTGSGVEVINFTVGYYGNLEELDLVNYAYNNNMTFHIIYRARETEDDELSRIHVDFPRVYEHAPGGTAIKRLPIWTPACNAFANASAGVSFEFDDNGVIDGAWIIRDWKNMDITNTINIYTAPFWYEACYATSI